MYSTSAGATPKHRKSDRLSNSAPNRLVAFSSRAMPAVEAVDRGGDDDQHRRLLPLPHPAPKRMAVSPAQRPSMVRMFGISRLKDGPW